MFLIYFTQANVPQITRHLAVCRQFNFNYDIFVIHFCKYKDFAKILFLPPLANNKTGNDSFWQIHGTVYELAQVKSV